MNRRRRKVWQLVVLFLFGGLLAATQVVIDNPVVVLGGSVAAALLAVGVFRPDLFLLLTLPIYSAAHIALRSRSTDAFGLNQSQLFMAFVTAVLVTALLVRLGRRQKELELEKVHFYHLWFFLCCCIAYFYSESDDAASVLRRLLGCLVVFFVGSLGTRGDETLGKYAIALTAAVAGYSAMVDAYLHQSILSVLSIGAQRADGAFGGPVLTACVAFAGLPVYVELLAIEGRRLGKWIAWFGIVSLVVSIVFTLTRTVVVGVSLFGFFLLLLVKGQNQLSRTRLWIAAVVPFVIIVGAIFVIPESDLEARTSDLARGVDASAGSGRVMIWKGVLANIRDSEPMEWVIGHGLAMVQHDSYRRIGIVRGAHNAYLQVFYDEGVVGLSLYLLMLGGIVQRLRGDLRMGGGRGLQSAIYLAFFLAYMLSVVMFNGYVYSTGPRWLTYYGIALVLREGQGRNGREERGELAQRLASRDAVGTDERGV